jgi:nucleotide-binding universal stress UspA family protein
MTRTTLVAVDGSPEAYNALIWVLDNLNKEGKVWVVYVISPSKYATIDGAAGYEGIQNLHEIRERIVNDEKEQVTGKIKELALDRNSEVDILVRNGDPRSEILSAIDEINANLLVVGSTGKGLGARLLLGSVSTYLLSHAKISTIVVR